MYWGDYVCLCSWVDKHFYAGRDWCMRQSTAVTHSIDWELISNIHFIVLFGVILITMSLRHRLGLAFSRSTSTHVTEVIWLPTGVTCFSHRWTIRFSSRVWPCTTTVETLGNTGWRQGRFKKKLWFVIRFIPVYVRVYFMNVWVIRHSILNIMCMVLGCFKCAHLRKNIF